MQDLIPQFDDEVEGETVKALSILFLATFFSAEVFGMQLHGKILYVTSSEFVAFDLLTGERRVLQKEIDFDNRFESLSSFGTDRVVVSKRNAGAGVVSYVYRLDGTKEREIFQGKVITCVHGKMQCFFSNKGLYFSDFSSEVASRQIFSGDFVYSKVAVGFDSKAVFNLLAGNERGVYLLDFKSWLVTKVLTDNHCSPYFFLSDDRLVCSDDNRNVFTSSLTDKRFDEGLIPKNLRPIVFIPDLGMMVYTITKLVRVGKNVFESEDLWGYLLASKTQIKLADRSGGVLGAVWHK